MTLEDNNNVDDVDDNDDGCEKADDTWMDEMNIMWQMKPNQKTIDMDVLLMVPVIIKILSFRVDRCIYFL